jgi:hypothetical protein
MAYLPFIVALNARDRRISTPDDSIALPSVSIAGTEVNGDNLIISTNSAILTHKTLSGLDNTFTDIQGSSLSASAKEAVLSYRTTAVWDRISAVTVIGSSVNITQAVESVATNATPTTTPNAKGVLTTGTGTGGLGIENYMAVIRNNVTGDPINDNENGTVYAQLLHEHTTVPTGSISSDITSDQVLGTDTTFLIDYQVGDGIYSAWGLRVGYVKSIESNTVLTLRAEALVTLVSEAAYKRRRFSLYFKKYSGGIYSFASSTAIDCLFAEVFDYNDRPWHADLYGTGFIDTLTMPVGHAHSASDISSGELSTDRFSAIADLVAEGAIGTASTQVAAGDHAHAFSQITGMLDPSQFSAYASLVANSKIGQGSGQVAAGDHTHDSAYNSLTTGNKIGTGAAQVAAGNHNHSFSQIAGMLAPSQFSAYADLVDENKIGPGSDQLAAGDHTHSMGFNQISGTVSPSQFSAIEDLVSEGAIGANAGQVAAGDHTHTEFQGATGFPYSEILASESITIAARQQMRVYQELKIEGDLIVRGELIVKDI